MKIPLWMVEHVRWTDWKRLGPRCETIRHAAHRSKVAMHAVRLCSLCLRGHRRCFDSLRRAETHGWKDHRAAQYRPKR